MTIRNAVAATRKTARFAHAKLFYREACRYFGPHVALRRAMKRDHTRAVRHTAREHIAEELAVYEEEEAINVRWDYVSPESLAEASYAAMMDRLLEDERAEVESYVRARR